MLGCWLGGGERVGVDDLARMMQMHRCKVEWGQVLMTWGSLMHSYRKWRMRAKEDSNGCGLGRLSEVVVLVPGLVVSVSGCCGSCSCCVFVLGGVVFVVLESAFVIPVESAELLSSRSGSSLVEVITLLTFVLDAWMILWNKDA